jgi:hypothetical protein
VFIGRGFDLNPLRFIGKLQKPVRQFVLPLGNVDQCRQRARVYFKIDLPNAFGETPNTFVTLHYPRAAQVGHPCYIPLWVRQFLHNKDRAVHREFLSLALQNSAAVVLQRDPSSVPDIELINQCHNEG